MALTVTEDMPQQAAPPTLTEMLGTKPGQDEYPAPFYRVFTPVEDFAGIRLGQEFKQGEAVVQGDAMVMFRSGKNKEIKVPVLKLFEAEMGYRVEEIPDGVPPVPRYVLAAAGMTY